MLRITTEENPGALTLRLEGRLVGPWVKEAQACWQRTVPRERAALLSIDLTGVTMIDAAGKTFLAAAHEQGAVLIAAGCLMRAIVADVTRIPLPDRRCP